MWFRFDREALINTAQRDSVVRKGLLCGRHYDGSTRYKKKSRVQNGPKNGEYMRLEGGQGWLARHSPTSWGQLSSRFSAQYNNDLVTCHTRSSSRQMCGHRRYRHTAQDDSTMTFTWNLPFLDPLPPQSQPNARKYALIILNQPFSYPLLRKLWLAASWRCCADGGTNRLYDALTADLREQ